MEITAIILGAGFSNRLGTDKLNLKSGKDSLLDITIKKALSIGFDEIIVVVKEEDCHRLKDYALKTVINPHAAKGKGSSIKIGVACAAIGNAYMFFTCDQPMLEESTIISLLEKFRETSKIVFPVLENKGGSPVIFPPKYREKLLALKDNEGGRAIIEKLHDTDEIATISYAHDEEARDIDTISDYLRLLSPKNTRWRGASNNIVVVRGGGDIATGVIQKLHRSGFFVVVLETQRPTAIRTTVALSQGVYDGACTVEDINAKLAHNLHDILDAFNDKTVPICIDPQGNMIPELKPVAVIDAILAKKNLGTNRGMAPITIALGPGFEAGVDVDIVIETMRGHNLGRVIKSGFAAPNTGVPGAIDGKTKERVIYSECDGIMTNPLPIGSTVSKGDVIGYIDKTAVLATIDGILRGVLPHGFLVKKNLKIADIDPRYEEINNYMTISDKARAIGGAVLEALLTELHRRDWDE